MRTRKGGELREVVASVAVAGIVAVSASERTSRVHRSHQPAVLPGGREAVKLGAWITVPVPHLQQS